jgi:Fe-S oxidoreductase
MESSKVTIRVQRFDPEKDDRPRDQDYELELPPGITILQTLNKIRAEQDPTLAYRFSCGSAICGSCAMKVNGHARLACKTQASDCNVLGVDDTFLGPASLAKAHRFIFDSRDANTDQRMREISEKTGVWECTHCGECVTRCPTESKPLERIEEIRVKAMAEGYHGNAGARHVLGFRESVGKRGMLNENWLLLRSVGFFNIPGLLSLVPAGLRMLLRGKTPPIIPHSIDKVDEVKKIFARFEELRK